MVWMAYGGAALLLMTVAHAVLPNVFLFLPLGGSSISEMGIVLGTCVAAATIAETAKGKK